MVDEPNPGAADPVDPAAPSPDPVDPANPADPADLAPADPDAPADVDWRAAANPSGDKNLEKMLKRFASPASVARALADTKSQLSKASTAALKGLPDDATDEQKAEWRKARDIPDAPEAYDIALKGIDWTDDDKAVLGDFAKVAHAKNISNEQAKSLIQWYADNQIADEQQKAVAAQKLQQATEKALKAEYGSDYARNIDTMKGFGIAQLGQEGWDGLVEAQLADGTRLGDNPAFMRLIVDAALDRGDAAPFEAGGQSGGQSDADMMKAHKELVKKVAAGDRDAKAKMDDPDYGKRIEAAYERQTRRDENGRRAA